jgi:flagellar hook protein FlgE
LGVIDEVMTQSGLTFSDSVYDCALQGEGFFQVMDPSGNIFYTRSGVFKADAEGNLCDPNGNIVLGVMGDPTGVGPSSQRIRLDVPPVQNEVASATKTVNGAEITISAAGYGPNGNISVTFQQSNTPFALLSGNNLVVQMDLNATYADAAAFQTAVNDAIKAGGVNLDDTVIPLSVKFEGAPTGTEAEAKAAKNTMTLYDRTDPTNTTPTKEEITFESKIKGAAGNAVEVALRASSTATAATAKWSDNVLTITVPEGGASTQQIQEAIYAAAGADNSGTGGDQDKILTVSGSAISAAMGAYLVKSSTVARVGLHGGADNFYAGMAKSLGTLPLQNGRLAAEQTHGDLSLVFIDSSGVIYGEHPVHGRLMLGRIDVVTFENPVGLDQVGTSYWKKSLASGEPTVKNAGQDGAAEIVSGALEMSNVDLSQEFSDMIITQRGFQANSRIITVSDTMLEELINLKR